MRNKWLYVFYFLLFITFTTYAQKDGNLNDTLPALAKEYIQSGHYEKADSLIHRLSERNDKKPSATLNITIQILKADLERAKGNHDRALQILKNIPLNRVEDDAIKAEYFYIKSKLAEDNNDAKRYVKKGIRLKKNIPLKGLTDLSGFYNSLGVYYRGLYKIDSAKYYYNKAIETAINIEGKPRIHEDIALFYQNLALPFAMQQDYEIAKKHMFKSVNILNQINKDKTDDLARNYLNLGRLYVFTGNLDSTSYYYDKVKKIRKKSAEKKPANLAIVYNNLGELQTAKFNMAKARIYFKKAQKLYKEADAKHDQKLQQIYLNLGFTYRNQEEYQKAIDYFKQALHSSNIITVGKAYRNMADCYFELEKPDSSDYYFKQAIAQFQSKKKRGRYDLGLTYIYYGNFLIDQGDDQALTYLKKGRNTLTKIFGDFHRDVSRSNTYIAKYYFQKKNYDKALSHAQKAIISSVNDFEEQNARVNPAVDKLSNKSHLITAISLKGQIFFQRGKEKQNPDDLETSFATFKTAIELINRVRLDYTYESSKLSITKRSQEEFSWILKVLKKLYHQTNNRKYLNEIFRYMEKSKAAVLLSSITESKAKITANLPDSLIEKEKWLRTRINGFKNLVYQERQKKTTNRNKKKIDEWESIIFRHQQQYDSLTEYIKKNYNQYYNLRMEPSILELDQVVN
ncbi:MAG: tetratricopeptide repeat protein [Bacteroidales bacterium]|nr:tetratricopeptide repeat protein [Bacteroidales bacterium]